MNMQKIVDMLFPVLLAAVGWLLTEIASFNNRLLSVESKMPALITAEGVPTDSPLSAERRHNMKEEIEHAAMLIEWLRRNDESFAKELKEYLFTTKDILKVEEDDKT